MATQGHILDANTLALWRLDESSGAAPFVDATGTYPFTSATNSSAVAGLIADGGKAKSVNSAENHAPSNAAADAVMTGSAWTVEAWVNVDPAQAAAAGVVLYQSGARTAMSLELPDLSGSFRLRWQTAGVDATVTSATGLIVRGTRYHLCARKNTATSCDLFLNGIKVASATGMAVTNVSGSGEFTLGGAGGAYLIGIIDDVRISKIARTDAEISDSFWRGIVDTNRPTSPRFQQLTSQAWQQYLSALATTQMQQPVGAAINMAFASQLDYAADRLRMALKAKFPSLAPPDALTQIGSERGMPQGQGETNAAYSARLLDAWNAWPWAGTAFGLLRAFYATGYTNVVLGQPNGGRVFTLDNGGTNLLLWSGALTNSAFGALFSTIVGNATAAPDGTTTAAKIVDTAAPTTIHGFNQILSVVGGTTYVFSIAVKAAEYNVCFLINSNTGFSSQPLVEFDLLTKTTATLSGSPVASGIIDLGGGWLRVWMAVVADATGTGNINFEMGNATGGAGRIYTGTIGNGMFVAWPQLEVGVSPGPISQTYSVAKTTALAAGSLLTSTESNGVWQNAQLSSPYTAPYKQTFWSQFDVVFPLPLNPSTFSWSGGIPSSSSAESNFIRALIAAWKPGHATCKSIVIIQQGGVWGYPTSGTWGETGDKWGSDTTTVWTP